MCNTHDQFDPKLSTAAADRELEAIGWNRRAILRSAAILAGAGATATATAGAAFGAPGGGQRRNDPQLTWLVGDHHVHTQYSHDAKYLIQHQLDAARKYGVDWLAFTEHSNFGHANNGGAVNSNREIREQRAANKDLLIFQGLEWYIPAAEHGSVLVAPGPNEVDLLRTFELVWDGKLNGWEKPAPGSTAEGLAERKAAEAIAWLAEQRRTGYIDDVLVLANHPMRLGIDSPHELRAWRDAAREVMIGMEGAPGAQGSGISQFTVPGDQRGEYTNAPSQYSFAGYPADAYRPYGGFDWATAHRRRRLGLHARRRLALLDHREFRQPPHRQGHAEDRPLPGAGALPEPAQRVRPLERGGPSTGPGGNRRAPRRQRLLARAVQPDPHGRTSQKLRRSALRNAQRQDVGGPRTPAGRA
ncbi:PHP domain-containing protein [Arthrobacter sp. JZ12]|uniref:PHP domain-containing protein n=1 Tax=Arthrobacter sp. JZ12 TaxID=2654190 RepID=UPI002B48BF4F|nr:PHP domain-containing protein [Arthrobacter sp. JZ12]